MGMSYYKPLFVYLTPASIPQVVAHIQKYLEDTPIPSDEETVKEIIQEYIEAHPELIAVSSVNGQSGTVVLTGSDININASSAVTLETQLSNLASMISSVSGDISQIESQLETIYTRLSTVETTTAQHTEDISGMQTTLEGYGTRIASVETLAASNASKNTEQDTRLTTAEGNISTIQTNLSAASENISTNEGNIETLQTFCDGISSFANLRIEFGSISITGEETTPGVKAFTFSTPFTSTPFVAFSIDGYTNRTLSVHSNNLSATGGNVVCKRIVDGTGTSGWGGSATVRYMAIGT